MPSECDSGECFMGRVWWGVWWWFQVRCLPMVSVVNCDVFDLCVFWGRMGGTSCVFSGCSGCVVWGVGVTTVGVGVTAVGGGVLGVGSVVEPFN